MGKRGKGTRSRNCFLSCCLGALLYLISFYPLFSASLACRSWGLDSGLAVSVLTHWVVSAAPCFLFWTLLPLPTSTSSSDIDPNPEPACFLHFWLQRQCLSLSVSLYSCQDLQSASLLVLQPPTSDLWTSSVCLQISSNTKNMYKGSLIPQQHIPSRHLILRHCLQPSILTLSNLL